MAEFGPETSAAAIVRQFSDKVSGRTFLINGVISGGVGVEIAVCLAQASPARLVLITNAVDTSDRQSIIDEIERHGPSVSVDMMTVDMSSFASVRKVAEAIIAQPSIANIDAVINIPTEMPRPYTKTEDELELLLQSNFLSYFLLTNKILPKVLSATEPRIVNISSSANKISGMRWHDLNFEEPGTYEPWTAYGQSKTAMILFTVALNEKLMSHAKLVVRSYAVHPGGVKTKVQEQLSEDALKKAFEGTKLRFGGETAREFFRWKTLAAASSTPLRAALDPSLVHREGFWLEDCELFTESVHLDVRATDLGDAKKLWGLSERLVGETFDF